MKKYLFLFILSLGIIFIPNNVFAQTIELGTPTYVVYDNSDNINYSGTSVYVGWWGTDNYFSSGHYLGSESGNPIVNSKVDYIFGSSNLCVNNDILISGYIGGLWNYFKNESYEVKIYNNDKLMSCTFETQENGSRLYYSCSGQGGGTYKIIVKNNSFSGTTYQVGISKDVDVTCNPTTSNIINNQNNNTNNIINNNNQNTQTIIDNIDDKFEKCDYIKQNIYYYDSVISDKYLDVNGNYVNDTGSYISDYISVKSNTDYNILATSNSLNLASYCLYDVNKNLISCQQFSKRTSIDFNTSNARYIRSTLTYTNANPLVLSYYQCSNRIDETNVLLKDTNNFLTSNEEPEADVSALGNVQGLLPPGPVDSLLNIPFKFLSIIVSSLGDLCVPLSMNWVFNQTLTLPCFSDSFYDNVPSGLMVFINLIPSGFILIMYFKHLYKKVNRAVSLETTADDEWGVL